MLRTLLRTFSVTLSPTVFTISVTLSPTDFTFPVTFSVTLSPFSVTFSIFCHIFTFSIFCHIICQIFCHIISNSALVVINTAFSASQKCPLRSQRCNPLQTVRLSADSRTKRSHRWSNADQFSFHSAQAYCIHHTHHLATCMTQPKVRFHVCGLCQSTASCCLDHYIFSLGGVAPSVQVVGSVLWTAPWTVSNYSDDNYICTVVSAASIDRIVDLEEGMYQSTSVCVDDNYIKSTVGDAPSVWLVDLERRNAPEHICVHWWQLHQVHSERCCFCSTREPGREERTREYFRVFMAVTSTPLTAPLPLFKNVLFAAASSATGFSMSLAGTYWREERQGTHQHKKQRTSFDYAGKTVWGSREFVSQLLCV